MNDNTDIVKQVEEFIRIETARVRNKYCLVDACKRAKAEAKRDFMANCKRHLVGNAVTVVKKMETLIRAGYTVNTESMTILPGFMDVWLTPPDKEIRSGVRAAHAAAVKACKLQQEIELKNALDDIQRRAAEMYDRLLVEQQIEQQRRERDAIISKLVMGEQS